MSPARALSTLADRGAALPLAEALLTAEPTAITALPPHAVQGAIGALLDAARPQDAARLDGAAREAGLPLPFPNRLILALHDAGDSDAAHRLARTTPFPGAPAPWQVTTRANLLEWTGALDCACRVADEGLVRFPKAQALLTSRARLSLLTGEPAEDLARHAETALPLAPADQIPFLTRLSSLARTGAVDLGGLTLSLPRDLISPTVALPILTGRYEAAEIAAATQGLHPEDRVLELGTGIGLVALSLWRAQPDAPILTVEANPELTPLIRENFAQNGCPAELVEGIAALDDGSAPFHLAPDFWASSTRAGPDSHPVTRPTVDVNRLIATHRPTILLMDIEGGELQLLPGLDLSGLRRLIIEFHPEHGPAAPISTCIAGLLAQGFTYDLAASTPRVLVFDRSPAP